MNEETRNLLIKELTKKSIERGGYILKKDINALLKMPEVPTTLAASTGENTNADNDDGIIVFLTKLVSPKIKPKKPPFFGPQKRDPKMTGM